MNLRRPSSGIAHRFQHSVAACALALALCGAGVSAQTGELVGRVVDQGGRPVAAAVVSLAGTTNQAVTDSTGTFRLSGLAAGPHRLQVQHIGYGDRTVEVTVEAGVAARLQLTLTETAIRLSPLEVEALTVDQRNARGAGFNRSVVTRQQLEQAENRDIRLADMLRQTVPNLRVRRIDRPGADVCIELRTIRMMTNRGVCYFPATFLDGVPVSSANTLYDNLDLNTIESVEVIQAGEANVLFGPVALYGAILITTRRPGSGTPAERAQRLALRPNFNWSDEPEGHHTVRVVLASTLANGIGAAVGYLAARQCLALRQPGYDRLVSNCGVVTSIGTGTAAIVAPALGNGVITGLVGRTSRSEGRFAPAAMGAGMTILPAYALVMSGYRNDSDVMKWLGYSVIVLGAPLVSTASDYLFRRHRE